ncbi:MAG: MarR family transcriptional regulator [Pseudomonadota bacterium]
MHDTELALLIDRLMRRIHNGLQASAHSFDRKGVGPGGGIILMTLADHGGMRLSDLTTQVSRDKSQMTRAIRVLEGKGLVARVPCETDGRVSRVSLTDAGHEVVAELTEAVAGVVGNLLTPLSAGEQRTLKDLLRRTGVDR